MAVQVLKARGVPEDRILFLNLIASPEGIRNFTAKFPKLRVVTAFVDQVSSTALLGDASSQRKMLTTVPQGLDEKKSVHVSKSHRLIVANRLPQLYHPRSR